MRLPEREYLVLSYSPRRARMVKEAEREASREIDAAYTLGEIDSRFALWSPDDDGRIKADAWYLAAFGATEAELIEALNDAVAVIRKTRWRPWRWHRDHSEAFKLYLRIDAQLGRAHGLTTTWM